MHQDIETSSLIGQWMPEKSKNDKSIINKINTELKLVINGFITYGLACLDDEYLDEFVKNLCKAWNFLLNSKISDAVQSCEITNNFLIEKINNKIFVEISEKFKKLKVKFENIRKQLEILHGKNSNDLTFRFVESEFIEAIRQGHWVLLDNINSAPQEVIERLNSLIEEKPVLNLYEGSEVANLTLGKGIHEEFRLFATSNMQRISSNKISTAFLNRVIRIWLPSIDKDLNFREFNDQILKGHLYNCIHDNDNQKSIFFRSN
jgi:midasin (ATPase involved in ribosome maturation)